jgi:hypothetical protein
MKCPFQNDDTVPYAVKSIHTMWICQVVLHYHPTSIHNVKQMKHINGAWKPYLAGNSRCGLTEEKSLGML